MNTTKISPDAIKSVADAKKTSQSYVHRLKSNVLGFPRLPDVHRRLLESELWTETATDLLGMVIFCLSQTEPEHCNDAYIRRLFIAQGSSDATAEKITQMLVRYKGTRELINREPYNTPVLTNNAVYGLKIALRT